MTMTKKIKMAIITIGWIIGLIALLCAGGAVDGSGTIEQVATLGLIGLVSIGVAIIAQRIGD